ncbi:MAG TPA: hypothetical protein VG709_06105, partial [Actinomycetota bacterium]|nr:hypothetical protein [Actinomycetota bacterium]
MEPVNTLVTRRVRRGVSVLAGAALLIAAGAPPASAAPETDLVSKTSGGEPANSWSSVGSISADGRFVAFESDATNLPGNDSWDVYVHDRRTGATELVSKTSGGEPANGWSFSPSISASGRFVAFDSDATNLPGGADDAVLDVYVHDRWTGTTELVSRTSGGDPANGGSGAPSISASGRFVAFASDARNLPGDDLFTEIYLHDRRTGRTRLVSKTSAGDPMFGDSLNSSLSASGRFVAFESAFNFAYVHDWRTGTTKLVSRTSDGDRVNGSFPSISADGRFVAFASDARKLPGNDGVSDVYVRDRRTRTTSLVSRTSRGEPANADSYLPFISADGRFVAFESDATNLPGND